MDREKYYPNVVHRFPFPQLVATCFGSLSIMSSGMHYGWASPSLPILLSNDSSYIHLTKEEVLWIPVAMPCGGFFGTIILMSMIFYMGRKWVLLLSTLALTTSWLLIANANSLYVLLTARFIAGIVSAIVMGCLPIYIAEISEPQLRGLLLSLPTFIWIIGVLVMNALGSMVTIPTAAYLSLIVPVLFTSTFFWMPETPYYLISKGKYKQARAALTFLRADAEEVEVEFERLYSAIKTQKESTNSLKNLLTNKANIKSLIIMMGTRGCQQFSGAATLISFVQVIFKEAGNDISPKVASTIYFSSLLITSGISSVIVDKTGRKPLFAISIASTGLALLIEASYFYIKNKTGIDTTGYSFIPIIGFIGYITAFSIGMQTIPILIIGEIFPTAIRSAAVSFSTIYYYICGIVVVQILQYTMEYGLHVPFFIYSIFCLLGFVFTLVYVPETSGLTLEEIEYKLSTK